VRTGPPDHHVPRAGGRARTFANSHFSILTSRVLAGRVIVSTTLLVGAILLQIRTPALLPGDPFFLLIALTFALTVLYAVTRHYAERHQWLIGVQLAVDVGTVSAFVFYTGGIGSYCSLLYVLPIIGGSILLPRRGGLTLAVPSALLYAGIVGTQYLAQWGSLPPAWLGPDPVALPSTRVAMYTVGTNVFAFVAVALLSGSLAEGARRADRRFEQASSAIADLKAFNQHVIDSLTSGLATTDRTGRLLTFNRAAETITGYMARHVIGKPASEVLQMPPQFSALLAQDLEGPQGRRADYAYRAGDGTPKDIGLSIAHLVTPDGRAGFLLTFQDVTGLRRLEREARRKQRLAAVGEMAAGIAHEIRNPLASLRGSIQILRQELALNEEQAQLMDIVLRESERLNETIRSFLSYARPQRRESTRFDVARMLNDAAVLLRNSADVKPEHRIEVDTSADAVWHEADENQLRQIVWNLATNGLRAMPDGGCLTLGAALEVPAATGDGGRLALRVSDQGVGIPAEELDGIFQPFHGTFAKGTGLGLAIVHRIVSDNDGEIQIESEVGKGTTVSVRLPVRTAAVTV
jgi:two-component system sensor histidine kinase PilS (NtrC family)